MNWKKLGDDFEYANPIQYNQEYRQVEMEKKTQENESENEKENKSENENPRWSEKTEAKGTKKLLCSCSIVIAINLVKWNLQNRRT